MDNAGRVRGDQCGGHLNGNFERLGDGQVLFAQSLAQRLAVDELGADEMRVLELSDFIDSDDVGVIESRGCVRFLLEPAHPILVTGDIGEKKFESDLAAQPFVLCQVDFAHSARAQVGKYFVLPNAFSTINGIANAPLRELRKDNFK
jgi:hypothetical protein